MVTEIDEYEIYFEFTELGGMIYFLVFCEEQMKQFGSVKVTLHVKQKIEVDDINE